MEYRTLRFRLKLSIVFSIYTVLQKPCSVLYYPTIHLLSCCLSNLHLPFLKSEKRIAVCQWKLLHFSAPDYNKNLAPNKGQGFPVLFFFPVHLAGIVIDRLNNVRTTDQRIQEQMGLSADGSTVLNTPRDYAEFYPVLQDNPFLYYAVCTRLHQAR